MDSTSKKVSFGFSKLKKPSPLVKAGPAEKSEVQFVDSFDGDKGKFSFKGTRLEEDVKKPLVIPLVGTKSAYDVIKAKLDEKSEAKVEEDVKPSLDELAAKEILLGIDNEGETEKDPKTMVIERPVFEGEKESSLEDYENIPVDDFGLAMLRGMGWTPETGIGKDSRVVAPITTEVRPKRLGLGAECPKAPGERPQLVKGSHVEILAGLHKNSVGMVEALDGDTGSLFIKLSAGKVISISETWVAGISPKEFERKLNSDKKPDNKYGVVLKEDVRREQGKSQLEEAMKNRKKRSRKYSSSPDSRRRHKKSKKHRRKSSSDEDRSKKSRHRR